MVIARQLLLNGQGLARNDFSFLPLSLCREDRSQVAPNNLKVAVLVTRFLFQKGGGLAQMNFRLAVVFLAVLNQTQCVQGQGCSWVIPPEQLFDDRQRLGSQMLRL